LLRAEIIRLDNNLGESDFMQAATRFTPV